MELDLVALIGQLGFPIAMCVALFWYMVKNNQAHKEEVGALKDAVNKLELAITLLTAKLEDKK